MRSDVAHALALAIFEDDAAPFFTEPQRRALEPILVEVRCGDAQADLRAAFIAVDWAFRRLLAVSLAHLGSDDANDLRSSDPVVDSLHALCAKELCDSVVKREPRVGALVEQVRSAIEELVWADAAVASRSGRAHPLAAIVERYARSGSFSDPLDIGYLDRTGSAVGSAVRSALGLGVPFDAVAGQLRALWAQFAA